MTLHTFHDVTFISSQFHTWTKGDNVRFAWWLWISKIKLLFNNLLLAATMFFLQLERNMHLSLVKPSLRETPVLTDTRIPYFCCLLPRNEQYSIATPASHIIGYNQVSTLYYFLRTERAWLPAHNLSIQGTRILITRWLYLHNRCLLKRVQLLKDFQRWTKLEIIITGNMTNFHYILDKQREKL